MDLKKILAELEIIKLQKNEIVKKLLKIMLDTDCVEIRNNIVFF